MARCPCCRGAMTPHSADRLYGRSMTIDICRSCEGIWFDDQELLQLAPAGTLALLAEAVRDESRPGAMSFPTRVCPRCGTDLTETRDRQRNTPFSYYRCPRGHGKFITFFQFLRAKNFVRPLAVREIDELRKSIRQVNCVNCGGSVNIERDAACTFCGTPLAILDPDQVRKALGELGRAAHPPADLRTLPLALAQERLRAERAFAEAGSGAPSSDFIDLFDAADSIGGGLRLLKALLRPLGP
jgi:Zn-finger nucleic acid-binding protein